MAMWRVGAAAVLATGTAVVLVGAPAHADPGGSDVRTTPRAAFSKSVVISASSTNQVQGSISMPSGGSKVFSAVTHDKFSGNQVYGTAKSRTWTPGKGLGKLKAVGPARNSDATLVAANSSGKQVWFAFHQTTGKWAHVGVRRQVGKKLKKPNIFKIKGEDAVPGALLQSRNASTAVFSYRAHRSSKEYVRIWQSGKGWSAAHRIQTNSAPLDQFAISADGSTVIIVSTTPQNHVRSLMWTRSGGWQAPVPLVTTATTPTVRSALSADGRSAVVAWSAAPAWAYTDESVITRTMSDGVWAPQQNILQNARVRAIAMSGENYMFVAERYDLSQAGASDLVRYTVDSYPWVYPTQVGPSLQRLGSNEYVATVKFAMAHDLSANIVMWSAGQRKLKLRAASWTSAGGASPSTVVQLPGSNRNFDFAASADARRYAAQDSTNGRKGAVHAVHGVTS